MYYFSYFYIPLFLGATVLAYFLTPLKKRWIVLLAASLLFYLANSSKMIEYMLITSAATYAAAVWLQKITDCDKLAAKSVSPENKAAYKSLVLFQKKAVVVLLVAVDFGILAALKYAGFAATNLDSLFAALHLSLIAPVRSVILPLGISFYTLQAVSYVVDVYRGKVRANRNYAKVLLFLCFFPQIVEGPIGRYDHLAPQLYEGHRFNYRNLTHGAQLILWGILKEYVIANRAGLLVDQVFNHANDYSGTSVMLAILLYTLQLYADFSGCIDVAAGSAQIFGISLAQNFRRPFFSRSVNEFWRRWHITLGAWLRDYIFYPVSLSRPLMKFSHFIRRRHNTHLGKWLCAGSALFFVWLGNGLWHGAGWKYLAYGMYYYVLMMLGMLCEPVFRKGCAALHINRESVPYRVFQILRTFVLVNIGMLIFRADTLRTAGQMFLSIFRGTGPATLFGMGLTHAGLNPKDMVVLAAGTAMLVVVGLLQEKNIRLRVRIASWPLPARWGVYLTAIFVLIIVGAYGTGYLPPDQIYASF